MELVLLLMTLILSRASKYEDERYPALGLMVCCQVAASCRSVLDATRMLLKMPVKPLGA